MFGKSKIGEMVAILIDHLDKVLETGERLGEARFTPRPITAGMASGDILCEHARLSEFLEGVRALEIVMAARADKARSWAKEIRGLDGNLKLMASLFVTGTQGLADAMAEIGDPRLQNFNGGTQALYYLKSRNLVADHIESLDGIAEIRAGEDTMLVGRMRLGSLLDLCETFIETLEVHYQLAPPAAATPAEAAAGAASLRTH
jgi:hypothetical protein